MARSKALRGPAPGIRIAGTQAKSRRAERPFLLNPLVRTRVVNLFRERHHVYIGNPVEGDPRDVPPGGLGFLGNPFTEGSKDEQIELFRVYFHERIAGDPFFRRAVLAIRGKQLGCFCSPRGCHGEVIAEWLNQLPSPRGQN